MTVGQPIAVSIVCKLSNSSDELFVTAMYVHC
jgi:hypothetical protein